MEAELNGMKIKFGSVTNSKIKKLIFNNLYSIKYKNGYAISNKPLHLTPVFQKIRTHSQEGLQGGFFLFFFWIN